MANLKCFACHLRQHLRFVQQARPDAVASFSGFPVQNAALVFPADSGDRDLLLLHLEQHLHAALYRVTNAREKIFAAILIGAHISLEQQQIPRVVDEGLDPGDDLIALDVSRSVFIRPLVPVPL